VDHDLIDAYVEALRHSLTWRTDIEDVVDEVADHLRENVARLVESGVEPGEAQRQTLACFGDLGLVARSFAQAPTGALAVPTRTTRAAGVVALAAGLAWLVAVVTGVTGGHTELLTTWTLPRYQIWTAVLVVAAGLTTLTMAGVLLRAGRLRRTTGAAAVAAGVVVTVTLVQWAWVVTVVMALLGVALLAGFRRDTGVSDHVMRPMRVLGAAWPLGALALVLANEVARVGPVDSYGDYQLARLASFVICATGSAWALAVVGLRLRAEAPATLDARPRTPVGNVSGPRS